MLVYKVMSTQSCERESRFKGVIKRLCEIGDTPERTALAFSIGVFLGFSPFLGFHTLAGVTIAFLFKLNRVALLVGVWSNTPWWVVPYYTVATWLGTWMTRFRIDRETVRKIFHLGGNQGFLSSEFWGPILSQGGLLLSFLLGSLVLAVGLSLIAYPLSLKWVRSCRPDKR